MRYTLGICRPLNTQDIVVVASIRPMQLERRKLACQVVRCLPDLDVRAVGDGNEPVHRYSASTSFGRGFGHGLAIRRKLDVLDGFVKVDMVQYDTLFEVYKEHPIPTLTVTEGFGQSRWVVGLISTRAADPDTCATLRGTAASLRSFARRCPRRILQ